MAFAASMDLAHLFLHLPDNLADLLCPALSNFQPAMASVSLAFIPYQPPLATARPAKGRLAPSNRSASKVSYRHNDTVTVASNVGSSAGLKDYELIEYVDLTDSLPIETMDIFSEPILAVGGTEGCVQGKVYYILSFDGCVITTSRSPLDRTFSRDWQRGVRYALAVGCGATAQDRGYTRATVCGGNSRPQHSSKSCTRFGSHVGP